MSTYTVITGKHATLANNVVDKVIFSVIEDVPIAICNRHTSIDLYVALTQMDGSSPSETLTPGEDDTLVIPPGTTAIVKGSRSVFEVTLVASGPVPYSVQKQS